VKRASNWAAEIEEKKSEATKKAEQARRDAQFEGPALYEALLARKSEITSTIVSVGMVCPDNVVSVTYPFHYSEEAVAIARTLPGARYVETGKFWAWSPKRAADVDAIIAGVNKIHPLSQRALDAKNARKAADRKQRQEEEAARYAARAERAKNTYRKLYAHGQEAPKKIDGGWVFTGYGKSFRITEDHPSFEGSHLLGHEGDLGRYAYYEKR
jgi:hypothetical protein